MCQVQQQLEAVGQLHAVVSHAGDNVRDPSLHVTVCNSLTRYSHHLLEVMFALKQRLCNGNIGVHVRTGRGNWTDKDFGANATYFLEVPAHLATNVIDLI